MRSTSCDRLPTHDLPVAWFVVGVGAGAGSRREKYCSPYSTKAQVVPFGTSWHGVCIVPCRHSDDRWKQPSKSHPGSLGSRLNVFFDVLSLGAGPLGRGTYPDRRCRLPGSALRGWRLAAGSGCSPHREVWRQRVVAGMRENETHGRSARHVILTDGCRGGLVDG